MKRSHLVLTVAAAAAVILGTSLLRHRPAGAEEAAKPDAAALERTRKSVRMLDDLYKTAVVLITDKYVSDEADFPAGGAAVALFDAMKKKGWHDVRLLDATGQPLEEKNAPQDGFERDAVKSLKGGKAYYEQVVQKEGKPYLRAATPIPVVMEKCVICHPHYKQAAKGAAIGALSYTLPIE
jgi:hypothetical protein